MGIKRYSRKFLRECPMDSLKLYRAMDAIPDRVLENLRLLK